MNLLSVQSMATARGRCMTIAALAILVGAQPAIADDTPATARDLGADPPAFATRDVVGAADTSDYYRFVLTTNRSVQITLTELSGDADLYLMSDNGVWLSSTRRGHGLSESIRKDIGPGTYRIFVYGWAGSVNHKLELKTWLPVPTGGTRQDLGTLDGMNGNRPSLSAAGVIQPTSGYADFTFTLPGRRLVSVSGSGNVAAALTPDAPTMQWSALNNNQARDLRLTGGRYILRVFRNPNSAERFSYAINARPYDTRDTAGYSTATARDLGRPGNPPVEIREYVGEDDLDDYYRVNISAGSILNVALKHTSGQNANVRVIDTLGRVIAQSANGGSADENISTSAVAGGIYYVHVGIAKRTGAAWENARYTARIGTVPGTAPRVVSTDASGSFNTPTPFADAGQVPGSGGQSLTDGESVGAANDPADVFYFNIGCNRAREVPTFAIRPNTASVRIRLFENTRGRTVERRVTPNGINKPAYQGKANYRYLLMITSSSATEMQYSIKIEHLGCLPG